MKAILFGVLAGVGWGVGELCTKLVLKSNQVGPVTAIAVRTMVALPILLLAWYAAANGWLQAIGVDPAKEPAPWRAESKTIALLVLGSGLSAGALALLFFYLGLAAGELSVVKPLAFALAPAIAVVLAWAILGEPLGAQKLAALAMILGGVVLLTRAH